MSTVVTDIRAELIADGTVNGIVAGSVFYRNPIKEQNGDAYITYIRSRRDLDDVREDNRFQIVCFSTSMSQLETLADAVTTLFQQKTVVNGNAYYFITFENQKDIEEKLKHGYYASVLEFSFKFTY